MTTKSPEEKGFMCNFLGMRWCLKSKQDNLRFLQEEEDNLSSSLQSKLLIKDIPAYEDATKLLEDYGFVKSKHEAADADAVTYTVEDLLKRKKAGQIQPGTRKRKKPELKSLYHQLYTVKRKKAQTAATARSPPEELSTLLEEEEEYEETTLATKAIKQVILKAPTAIESEPTAPDATSQEDERYLIPSKLVGRRRSLQDEFAKLVKTSIQDAYYNWDEVSCSISPCPKEDFDYQCTYVGDTWPETRKDLFKGLTHAALCVRDTAMLLDETSMIERCVVRFPGVLLFKLSMTWIAQSIHKIVKEGMDIYAPNVSSERAILYDLSGNIAEKMHMGRLRSTVIGETLARILQYSGVEVIRRHHEKDVLELTMMMEYLIEKFPNKIVNDLSPRELEVLSMESKKKYCTDFEFRKRAEKGWQETYERLGILSEGEKFSVDLAALWHALNVVKADMILHVTDVGQHDYFEMCICTAKRAGWIVNDSCPPQLRHVGFGFVQADDYERLLDEVKIQCKTFLLAQGKAAECTAEELEDTAEALAYGAVKYEVLKNNRLSNCTINFDEIMNEKGNTVVYLLKTHAQLSSIIKEHRQDIKKLKKLERKELEKLTLKNNEERELGLRLLRFTEVIKEVCTVFMPHILCEYVYQLCQKYDTFYAWVSQVDGYADETALLLFEATNQLIRKCFTILAITPLRLRPVSQANMEWKPKSGRKPNVSEVGVIGTPKKSKSSPAKNSVMETAQLQDKSSLATAHEDQNVIIPAHIRVSGTDRCRLTFGTLGIDVESSKNPESSSSQNIGLVLHSSPSYSPSEPQQQHGPPELPSFSAYDPQTGYDMSFYRPATDESLRAQVLQMPLEASSSDMANNVPATTIPMVQQQAPLAQMYPQVHVPYYAMPFRQFLSPVYGPPMVMPNYSNNPTYSPHSSTGNSYVLMPGVNSPHVNANGLNYAIPQFKSIQDGNVYVPNPQAETSELWMNPRDMPSMQSASYYNMAGQTPHAAYLQPSHGGHASFNAAAAAAAAAQSSHMQFPGMYHPSQPEGIANPHHMGPTMGGNVGVAPGAPGSQVGGYQQQPQLSQMSWTGNF